MRILENTRRIPADMICLDGSRGETMDVLHRNGIEILDYQGHPDPEHPGEFKESYIVGEQQAYERGFRFVSIIPRKPHPQVSRLYGKHYQLVKGLNSDEDIVLEFYDSPIFDTGIAVEVEQENKGQKR